MKKLHLLLLFCLMNIAALALNGPCTPWGVGSGYSGTTSYCIGEAATPITYNYSECSIGAGAPTGVECQATWYYNTTNSTVINGSTVTVSGPTTFTSEAGTNGDLPTFTPSTSTTSTRYYFCRVTWTDPGTCTSPYTTGTVQVKVNALPASIAGLTSVCEGSTVNYTCATGGGMSWTSSNTGIATVGYNNGVVTGVSSGVAVITYTLLTGCYSVKSITVNTTPASITGTTSACVGSTTALGSATGGGTWASSNTAVGTVNSATGVVTGKAGGTTRITYALATGCRVTQVVTVYPSVAIGGPSVVCEGFATITLTNTLAGGTWSSSDPSLATVGTSGIVTGVSDGVVNITYTTTAGCERVKTLTVNQIPMTVDDAGAFCQGSTITVSNGYPGGTWSSSNAAVASIGTDGTVTGVAAGTARISYNLATGCRTTAVVTVNARPAAITGTFYVCEGQTRTLASATGGGTWSSSDAGIADIGSATGIVSGIAAGGVTITYEVTATGCFRTTAFTVRPLPSAIAGTLSVCPGATTTLTDPSGAGSWASSSPTNATIGVSTGILTGASAGTTSITFTYTNTCFATAVATVEALPTAISGTFSLCVGDATTLSSDVGGTWSSSNISKATVGSGTGIVTGIAAGVANITYLNASGCRRVQTITVNANPVPIAGLSSVCDGTTTTLTNPSSGGAWSSSDGGVATISVAGLVTGVAPGNATMSYTLGTGCFATKEMTVISTPATSTGTHAVCISSTTTLSNTTPGGTWSSSATGVAQVGVNTGIVTGITAGNANITYSIGAGCFSFTEVTTNPLPAVITGLNKVCETLTTTLADATGGGTWSSSNTSAATIGSSSGIVTGVAVGTTNISYTSALGCSRSLNNFNVYALPAAIGGTFSACPGTTTTLTNATPSGNWASSNNTVATVNVSSGVVSGNTSGTTTIFYTLATGCRVQQEVTVDAAPAAITGIKIVCAGLTSTLSSATPGGEWSSANGAIATIGSADGIVTAISGGTVTITYTTPAAGCYTTTVVTVITTPAAITGTASMCEGFTTTLSDITPGGAWSSSNGTIATVGTSGIVTGVSSGNADITYELSPTCFATKEVTVNAVTPITGTLSVCVGATTTLSHGTPGGTWASSNFSKATIGSASGIATGTGAGNAYITYTPPTGCRVISIITVNGLPATITGTTNICAGLTTTLSSASAGGDWTSSAPGIFTIDISTGEVTAITAGSGTVTYTLPTGCFSTVTFVVNPNPAAITGTASVCEGATTVLSSASSGSAQWSSSDDGTATIGSSSGVVTGVASGNATITYTLLAGSCSTTIEVTVNPLPDPIGGSLSICTGTTSNLTNPDPGTWASSNNSVATIGTGGILTAISAGNSTITYTLDGTGCRTTSVATVNAPPAAITGGGITCVGAITTFSNATPGGTWSSAATGTATVGSATGVVTGAGVGNTTISYTVTATGCFATKAITVLATPAAITGTASVCVGLTTTLSNATPGGTWSSDATGIATVGSATGVVSGVSGGTANIEYSLGSGCTSTVEVTVNTLPAAITGTTTVCVGTTTTLSNADPSGTWSSSNTAKATVGSATGVVTGVSSGTATITYLHTNGCANTTVVTINANTAITGTASVCVGNTTTLANATAGGTWSSSNVAAGTIGSTTGIVTGIASGVTTISYTTGTSCVATRVVTVNDVPTAITYSGSVCTSSTTAMGNTISGGAWSSSNTARATVVSATGIVTGISAGIVNITYSTGAGSGCAVTTELTVNTNAAAITGTASACVGLTSTLANATGGGTWTTSNATIATVGSADGIVTAVAAGTATVTYSISNGCFRTTTFTSKALPSAINGTASVCVGSTTNLSNATGGGVSWTSSTPAVATISGSGIVTGVSAGNSTITYLINTGCYITREVTVNALPDPITGTASVCKGLTTTLTSSGVGTWASSNTAVATVGTSGVVTGVNGGTTTITYTLGTGCRRTQVATVNPTVTISGNTAVCDGATTALTITLTSGVWSSSNNSIATVGTSGIVTGVAAGNVDITFTSSAGCIMSKAMTVNTTPDAITGTASVCAGLTTTLSSNPGGGAWTSSAPAKATVSGGVVSGVSAGNANISYTLAGGCFAIQQVTVNAAPATITGTTTVCIGSTTTLSNVTGGGTWESSDVAIATVGSASGVVTGVLDGSVTISYTLSTGCRRTTPVIVSPLPAAISGSAMVCPGTTQVLSNTTPGGLSWTSSNTAVATVGSTSGLVTGITPGTTNITYTLTTGCKTTQEVTVNPNPAAFTPTTNVLCQGFTVDLDPGTAGGTWSSSNSAIATVGSAEGDGVVSGDGDGTATISYIITATGCYVTRTFTVNANQEITGTAHVCVGATTTLASGTAGGAWSSVSGAIATIGTTGIVTGISPGNSTISYLHSGSGCFRTVEVTVDPLPDPIADGDAIICVGNSSAAFTNTTGGGTWSTSNGAVATIGSANGIANGNSGGEVIISYTTTGGCIATTQMTVGPFSGTISGPTTVEELASISLVASVGGGAWDSENDLIATVDGSGEVTGTTGGGGNSVEIYYETNMGGCGTSTTTYTVTVTTPRPGGGSISSANEEHSMTVAVQPNPNTGAFTVKGSFEIAEDREVSLVLTDVLGHIVYNDVVMAKAGNINIPVMLNNTPANGLYMLTIRAGAEKKVFQLLIKQ